MKKKKEELKLPNLNKDKKKKRRKNGICQQLFLNKEKEE